MAKTAAKAEYQHARAALISAHAAEVKARVSTLQANRECAAARKLAFEKRRLADRQEKISDLEHAHHLLEEEHFVCEGQLQAAIREAEASAARHAEIVQAKDHEIADAADAYEIQAGALREAQDTLRYVCSLVGSVPQNCEPTTLTTYIYVVHSAFLPAPLTSSPLPHAPPSSLTD